MQYADRQKKTRYGEADIILLYLITNVQKKINATIGLHVQKQTMCDEGSLMRNLTSNISRNKQPHNKKNFLFNESFPNRTTGSQLHLAFKARALPATDHAKYYHCATVLSIKMDDTLSLTYTHNPSQYAPPKHNIDKASEYDDIHT